MTPDVIFLYLLFFFLFFPFNGAHEILAKKYKKAQAVFRQKLYQNLKVLFFSQEIEF